MTIFVKDIKGMTAIEVEYYCLNEAELIGEFVTVNGRKGHVKPYENKEKKAIMELYKPIVGKELINGDVIWN